jgi:hypothetical protein
VVQGAYRQHKVGANQGKVNRGRVSNHEFSHGIAGVETARGCGHFLRLVDAEVAAVSPRKVTSWSPHTATEFHNRIENCARREDRPHGQVELPMPDQGRASRQVLACIFLGDAVEQRLVATCVRQRPQPTSCAR